MGVASRVHEMSARTLEFGLPDLDSHRFGEDLLGELALGCTESYRIIGATIEERSSSLMEVSMKKRMGKRKSKPTRTTIL